MKVIKEDIVFQWKIIEVVNQTVQIGEKEVIFEMAKRSPGVRLIICDETRFLITKEFRKELNDFDYRLPGGKVFNTLSEYNEKKNDIETYALAAAKNECKEETWLIAEDIALHYISHAWATIERDLYYYIVKKFTPNDKGQELELWENITVEWKTKQELLTLIKSWAMHEDRSVGVVLKYLM